MSAASAFQAACARTRQSQATAADPAISVWVAANAGTGKTHVLTNRVLRLLLSGTRPECILCLTYTKAAAAEMSKRVFDKLAAWVTCSDDALAAALREMTGGAPSREEMTRARALFAQAIETPGGLKVQTIHAFCERLLQRFPLEAGVPPGFAILDDETGAELLREATDDMLTEATRVPGSELGRALKTAVAFAVEDGFDSVLRDALQRREWLEAAQRLARDDADPFAAADKLYRRHVGIGPRATTEDLEAEMAALIAVPELEQLRSVLLGGSKTDLKAADVIAAALAATTDAQRVDAFADFFLTGEGEARKSLMTKKLREANTGLDAQTLKAQARFAELAEERRGLDLVTATMALLRLADAVMQRYAQAKARRAALDFDDLIQRTKSLLLTSGNAQWVLYKLDSGLEHILVDESQDTSPAQWSVIEALADEFFAGSGAAPRPRTVFAVGDEKQSIYSFQGAAPEMFARMGRHFLKKAEAAGASFRSVPLNLSFRTVQPVLDAVDRVFADADRTPGLTAETEMRRIEHIAFRAGQAGLVEIWPTVAPEDAEETDAFAPLSERSVPSPVAVLADRIATQIKAWLDGGEVLTSENRRLEAGDILILVRRRNPFAPAMVAALKARDIPVAGADRIALTGQIAVQDLLALGDFLTLPEDDLALATVLKSPLFGLDDLDLMSFAPGRKGLLWSALLEHAKTRPRLAEAAETLKRWRSHADFAPPYEFFSTLLDRDGGRARMLARLGPDAADPIDELLNMALSYDDNAPPSLQGFLAAVRSGAHEIKRDMEHGRNQVRVMTVHGAKGLEAPIVFLPDTCSAASGRQPGSLLTARGMPRPSDTPDPFLWPVKGTSGHAAVRAAKAEIDGREAEERNRLLYVAMTRARDRLYVCGYEGRRGVARGSWYEQITEGLAAHMTEAEQPDGTRVRRLASPQSAPHDKPKRELADDVAPVPLPGWAARPAPTEARLSIPLAPSRLAPYDTDETGEPVEGGFAPADRPREPAAPSPRALVEDGRFLRGTITHALLEHLPGLPSDSWREAASAFVEKRGAVLRSAVRSGIVAETLAILSHPEFAPLFAPGSRAEVPIAADIPRPRGKGPPLRIAGSIDRLAHVGDTLMIVDYKTNRPPPAQVSGVSDAYLFQLAAYALAVGQVFATDRIRAALLWTDGPRIMEIPAATLATYQSRLWDLDPARLDG